MCRLSYRRYTQGLFRKQKHLDWMSTIIPRNVPIDQTVIWNRFNAFISSREKARQQVHTEVVIPIINHHDKISTDIVVGFAPAMDNQRAEQAVLICRGIMGMPPICSRLLQGKVVRKRGVRQDSTLCDGMRTIHKVGP